MEFLRNKLAYVDHIAWLNIRGLEEADMYKNLSWGVCVCVCVCVRALLVCFSHSTTYVFFDKCAVGLLKYLRGRIVRWVNRGCIFYFDPFLRLYLSTVYFAKICMWMIDLKDDYSYCEIYKSSKRKYIRFSRMTCC